MNRRTDHKYYRMNDLEYFSQCRPIYEDFSLDNALQALRDNMKIDRMGRVRRFFVWMNEMSYY